MPNGYIKLILQVGVPAAIACFLVWVISTQVVAEVRQTRTLLESHTAATSALVGSFDRQERLLEVIRDISRQACVNQAKTSSGAQSCFDAGR